MDNLPLGAANHPDAPFNEPLNTEHKRFVSVTISYYDTVEAPVNSSDDFIEKSFYKKVFDGDIPKEFDIDEVVDSEDEEELLVEDEDVQEEATDDTLCLSDAIQRDLSKNLKKAFTLNDRFRYRRELFENSDVQMTNTLNLVETMESFSEAEDYFYSDMEWDRESPEVRDFMEIIKQHFL